VLKQRLSNWKAIHWVFLGLAAVALLLLLGVALLALATATALDTDRELKDFASPAQARDFVSAHLPTPLPVTAVVEELRYQRWTDWHLQARVRFESPAGVASYVSQAKLQRASNDAYCGSSEPSGGVSFFLSDVTACGSATVVHPASLKVVCHTR
jgi:hypothetical protein